jgi:hypothetical protein
MVGVKFIHIIRNAPSLCGHRLKPVAFGLFSPVGWEAVGLYSPKRSRRNSFGFKSVSVISFLLPKILRRALMLGANRPFHRPPSSGGKCGEEEKEQDAMTKHNQQTSNKRQTVYQQVTARIIQELEQGRVPWVQPWGNGNGAAGLPANADTGTNYSGINILLLWGAVFERGFSLQSWLTYKQAQKLGGTVRKGEKSTSITYADSFITKEERQTARAEQRDPERIPFLKRYSVFNIAQCEGLPKELYEDAPELPEC